MRTHSPSKVIAYIMAAVAALAIWALWDGEGKPAGDIRDPAAATITTPAQEPAVVPQAAPPRSAEAYRQELTVSARRVFGPDAPIAALAAQIQVESGWNADARSRAGAMGLAQFMPGTADDMARRFPADCAPSNPYSSRWALSCRDRYMRSLLGQIKPIGESQLTEQSHWAFAFRAYNGGSIIKDRMAAGRAGANPDSWSEVQPFNGRGRSAANFKENTEYPVKIFWAQNRYAHWGRTIEEVGGG